MTAAELTQLATNAGIILGVQAVPLLVGYKLKTAGRAKESWGRPLSRFIIVVIETVISLLAAWRLDIDWSVMLRMLPVAALFGLAMTAVGWTLSHLHSSAPADRGGYILATAISNFGFTMAGFVCLMVGGQDAVSIQSIYIAPLGLLIYLLWFPLARHYGTPPPDGRPRRALWLECLRGLIDVTALPLWTMFIGLALHEIGARYPASHLRYPDWMAPVLPAIIYADVVLSMFCVGITLQLNSLFQFRGQTFTVSLSKYLIAPVVGIGLAWLFDIHGTHLLVVIVCSSVPVGLFSTFAANLFGLNRNLTNALLILTTAAYLLVVLPILLWLLPLVVK